jgi:hypothetical protein
VEVACVVAGENEPTAAQAKTMAKAKMRTASFIVGNPFRIWIERRQELLAPKKIEHKYG